MDTSKERIQSYVKQITSGKLAIDDIPAELFDHPLIIRAEREAGLRTVAEAGFNVLENKFFVNESLQRRTRKTRSHTVFNDFEWYYRYLGGHIYENACYYQCCLSKTDIKKFNIRTASLNTVSFRKTTIDQYNLANPVEQQMPHYLANEELKEDLKQWSDRINNCKDSKQLKKIMKEFRDKYNTDDYYHFTKLLMSVFMYRKPEEAFDILIDCLTKPCDFLSVEEICYFYKPESVQTSLVKKMGDLTQGKPKKRMEEFIHIVGDLLVKTDIETTSSGFDKKTHYFYKESKYPKYKYGKNIKRVYFDSFDEFITYLNYDLSDCVLTEWLDYDKDLSVYKANDKTKLPDRADELQYVVEKKYDPDSRRFEVTQYWLSKRGLVLNSLPLKFVHFCDFVYFLKGDLSNADLYYCEGIRNLHDLTGLNLENAKLKSEVMDVLGISYTRLNIKDNAISFRPAQRYEKITLPVLREDTSPVLSREDAFVMNLNKISYISDIHLVHKMLKCRTLFDVEKELDRIVPRLVSDTNDILLIAGDTASDFNIFSLFVKKLSRYRKGFWRERVIVFVLGNHELWPLAGKTLRTIYKKYRDVIEENGMYLLQNSILLEETGNNISELSEKEITRMSSNELKERLRKADLVIFGGTAFSGYNNKYNADSGIYANALNRNQEIAETKKFEQLYLKVSAAAKGKSTVIMTHTPMSDWSSSKTYIDDFVYVSGHNHRNYIYDDGTVRVYSDNQIGYSPKVISVKTFYLDKYYDYFSDYPDGIYEISKDQYNDFYHGKNITMDYNRDGRLFLLKKNKYYCFIRESPAGKLFILNGGAIRSLTHKDIQYYFDNMDSQIQIIRAPLDRFTDIQKRIADAVRKIGGSGRIHGCIIDIDYFNHIYVNPYDLKLTGYYATSIVDKYVYENIPSLLKDKCPLLFNRYMKLLHGKKNDYLLPALTVNYEINTTPTYYPDTDIYTDSRIVKQMQKLNKGILTIWNDVVIDEGAILANNK